MQSIQQQQYFVIGFGNKGKGAVPPPITHTMMTTQGQVMKTIDNHDMATTGKAA